MTTETQQPNLEGLEYQNLKFSDYANPAEQEISKEIDAIAGKFSDAITNQNELVRLPEGLFTDIFIPVFLGLPVKNAYSQDEDDEYVTVRNWINIVGGPNRPAIVVSETTHEDLYVVPPVIDIQRFAYDRSSDDGRIRSMINEYDANSYNVPARSAIQLQSQLYNLVAINKDSKTKYFDTWVSILQRYDYIDKDYFYTDKLKSLFESYGVEFVEDDRIKDIKKNRGLTSEQKPATTGGLMDQVSEYE